MNSSAINVSARIDDKIFSRFAFFDAFQMKKRWRSPLIFALILTLCSLVCFSARGSREGAALLGWVLLCVGLGLPATYFLNFWLSLKAQCKKLQLAKARLAYTLTLDAEGVRVSNEKEHGSLEWDKLFAAHRDKGCIYLYASVQKAYLLPEGCADADGAEVWAFIAEHMPAGRAVDHLKA